MLNNIRIVLVGTTHPGNIGAAARAMKTMGLERLCLVSPKTFPAAEATARASGADDLLARAEIVSDLDSALRGCRLVIGASARRRSLEWPMLEPRECGLRLSTESGSGPVALVFGREHSGLSNAELDHCHYLVQIPTNPEFRSLNLAASVQVLAYEILCAHGEVERPGQALPDVAPSEDIEGLFVHLRQALADIGYLQPQRSTTLMRRLRRLFLRARPDRVEVNILRGILSAAQGRKSMRSEPD